MLVSNTFEKGAVNRQIPPNPIPGNKSSNLVLQNISLTLSIGNEKFLKKSQKMNHPV